MEAKKHGGSRPNSGKRTELIGDPVRRVQVTLDQRTVEMLLVIGGGNLSYGVRAATRVAYDRYQRTP